MDIHEQNRLLRKDIKIIYAENEELKIGNKELEEDNSRLDKEVRHLTAQLFKMTLEMEELKRKGNVSSRG